MYQFWAQKVSSQVVDDHTVCCYEIFLPLSCYHLLQVCLGVLCMQGEGDITAS